MLLPSHSHIWQLCLVPYIFITLDGLSLGRSLSFECQFGVLLLYMVKGARECCVWKICSEFAQICGGKSVNLKLPHKIKLSWINLQHSPLGDILNNVLFKAFLLCFFSRTRCSAAYSKLWPTDFFIALPQTSSYHSVGLQPSHVPGRAVLWWIDCRAFRRWDITRIRPFLSSSGVQHYGQYKSSPWWSPWGCSETNSWLKELQGTHHKMTIHLRVGH